MTTTDEERIARRYPKRSVWDYLVLGGIGTGVALAIMIAAIAGWKNSSPPVAAMVRSFIVDSPTKITVELLVQRNDPSRPAQCQLIAQAHTYEEVGEAVVTVPAGTKPIQAYTFEVTTVKEPVSIDEHGCQLVGK